MNIEVKGHSGCNIEIKRAGSSLYIEKSTTDRNYASRLLNQAVKQKKAALQEYQHIRVPKIYEINKEECGLTVKMEYVYSRNIVDHFENAGFEQINYFIQAFEQFIKREVEQSEMQNLSYEIIEEKWADVKNKIGSNERFRNDSVVSGLTQKAEAIFMRERNSVTIPVGVCHGDLTLSNILFNGNNYYLIDFLDSFIETPLMDIVKLRQDTAYLWSPLMYTGTYDVTRLNIICNKIDRDLDKYFSQYEWYRRYYDMFQLLNFFRILQYAKEEKVVSYLKMALNRILSRV